MEMIKSGTNKLLYLNQTLGMGGAETFMSELLRQLQIMGWHVKATAVHQPFIELLESSSIKTDKTNVVIDIVGDYKGLTKALFLWPLAVIEYSWKLLKNRNTDIVLVSSFAEKIFGTLVCVIFRKPIVWIEFASVEPLLNKFGGLPGILYKKFLPYPKYIITSSIYSANILKEELPKVAEKIIAIPCGIKIKKIRTSKKPQNSPPELICVSRLEKGKGQEYLIAALKKVQLKIPDLKLKIVGIGETLYSLKRLAKELKLQKYVTFEGYVADAKSEMKMADICVFPTLWQLEGFGIVAVEAMSVGTPLIAFDFGPLPEIIKDGKNGLLAKAGDIDDLAQKIIFLLNDRKLQNELAKNGLNTVKKRFTIEIASEAYHKYLLEALEHSRKKSG